MKTVYLVVQWASLGNGIRQVDSIYSKEEDAQKKVEYLGVDKDWDYIKIPYYEN